MSLMKSVVILLLSHTILTAYAQVNRPVGINLSYVADYSTELVFTNTFRQGREWISSNADNTGPWDTGVNIPLRPDGYPLQIPYSDGVNPPQKVKTLLMWDLLGATPTGQFRLKSSGSGQIRLINGASGTFSSPVDTLVQVNNGVILEILSSQAGDPVRDIQFILPAYVNTYQNQTFTNELTGFLEDFQVIRFMDFTQTNGSPIQNWAQRTPQAYYTQAKFGGVAWEYVVQLANQTQKDVWINIPHQANNAYIDSLAHLLQNSLNSTLKVYLEYSNEVWNGAFSQNAYCAQMGQNLGYSGPSWERAWKYTAKRSADVFKIFQDVFTNDERLVKIIPSQAANSWLTNELITFFNDPFYNPHQVTADAVAIAPYIGNEVADAIVSNGLVNSITVPQIIDLLEGALIETQDWIDANQAVADNHNLQLICYEGGQHLVATGNNVNNATLTQKLIATNRHPDMQALYCQYLDYWYNNAGGLLCHFSSVQPYTQWGSWGLLENHQDTLNPKYLALQNCAFAANISGAVPVVTANAPASVCAGTVIVLTGTISGSVNSGTWSSSGTGTFANAGALSTSYTPSALDIASGSVSFTLTSADPVGPTGPGMATATTVIHPIPAVTLTAVNDGACAFGQADIVFNTTGGSGEFTTNAPAASFSTTANTAILDVSTACAGTWNVTFAVTQNGCTGSHTISATVQNCGLNVSGQLKFVDNLSVGVANAQVILREGTTGLDTAVTTTNGNFQVEWISGNSFTITPTKNRAWNEGASDGVSSADASRILQHVGALPANQITSAYKRIAADVDASNTINGSDAALILQSLTGNLSARYRFTSRTWVFVPESQALNTTNWHTYQTNISFTNPCDAVPENFIGIKLGDVISPNAIPSGAFPPQENSSLNWSVADVQLEEGNEITAEFRAMSIESMMAFQFAMVFDTAKLELLQIELDTDSPIEPFWGTEAHGVFKMAYASAHSISLAEETPVFRLRFRVKQSSGMLSQAIQIEELELIPEVYTTDNFVPGDVNLWFSPSTGNYESTDISFHLNQNKPNPFKEKTVLGFSLPAACEVRLQIFDLKGRSIYFQKGWYESGPHELVIDLGDKMESGLFFCELASPWGVLIKKMLKHGM